jgi:hypothetical protein
MWPKSSGQNQGTMTERDNLEGRQRATRPSDPAAHPVAGDTNDIV